MGRALQAGNWYKGCKGRTSVVCLRQSEGAAGEGMVLLAGEWGWITRSFSNHNTERIFLYTQWKASR